MSANNKSSGESVREPEADEARRPVGNVPDNQYTVPLFLRDGNDGRKGDAQDDPAAALGGVEARGAIGEAALVIEKAGEIAGDDH